MVSVEGLDGAWSWAVMRAGFRGCWIAVRRYAIASGGIVNVGRSIAREVWLRSVLAVPMTPFRVTLIVGGVR